MTWEELIDLCDSSGLTPDEIAEKIGLFYIDDYYSTERYGTTMLFNKKELCMASDTEMIKLYRLVHNDLVFDHYEPFAKLWKEVQSNHEHEE